MKRGFDGVNLYGTVSGLSAVPIIGEIVIGGLGRRVPAVYERTHELKCLRSRYSINC